jgi:DNA polymerase IV (DinB-like DNA polymerase)
LKCDNEDIMRIIAHLDMDAFFASVEEREKPYLAGMPVVVGADPLGGQGRGVVSTANYRARKYGIRSAMPISKAWRLSEEAKRRGEPRVIFITPNFQKYSRASSHIMRIIRTHAPEVEAAGIDEAYFDLSFTGSYKKAETVCQKIKKEIKEKESLTASVGIGPNKLIAKIASDVKKPDGLTIVTEAEAADFLAPLPLRKISGVGPKTAELFARKKTHTIADARRFSREELIKILGKWGNALYEKVRGIDDALLEEPHEAKSIGEQETFLKDTKEINLILKHVSKMAGSISRDLARRGFKGFRTVTVTIRFADFETTSRSHTLKTAAASSDVLEREALHLLLPFFDHRKNPEGKLIRLIGLRIEKLVTAKEAMTSQHV